MQSLTMKHIYKSVGDSGMIDYKLEAMRCKELQQELIECLKEAERLVESINTAMTLSIPRGQQDECYFCGECHTKTSE